MTNSETIRELNKAKSFFDIKATFAILLENRAKAFDEMLRRKVALETAHGDVYRWDRTIAQLRADYPELSDVDL